MFTILFVLGLSVAVASALYGVWCVFSAAGESADMTDAEARAYLLASSGAVRVHAKGRGVEE